MNKYFIQLFLKENTVILPGFGALTAPNGNIEEIMFLPYLKTDDGKLTEFIVETEGIDPQDAQNTIAKFIREIKANLSKGESFDIFQFGSFFKNEDGEIVFDSWMKEKEGTQTVTVEKESISEEEAQGIETTETPQKEEKETGGEPVENSEAPEPIIFNTESIKETTENIEEIVDNHLDEKEETMEEEKIVFAPFVETSGSVTPTIEKEKKKRKPVFWIIGIIALLGISALLFNFFGKKKTDSPQVAQTNKKEDPKKSEVKKPIQDVTKTEQTPPPEKEEKDAVIVSESTKGYYLISGVYQSTKSAEVKLSKLKNDGISGKILQEGPKKFYVSLADFTDRNLATEKLLELRSKGFKAWTLEK